MAIVITGDNFNNVLTAGSAADHEIYGLGGADTLTGSGGNDLLDGGTGSDTMTGGGGSDVYIVDSSGDSVSECFLGGIDRVESSISYTLGANVENLTLTGAANLNGYGNALNNVIIGNSGNNILNGYAGADTMTGGAGNDSYHVDNAGDLVVEAAGGGTDWVYSTVSRTLEANVENLDLDGAAAINGYGNELANTMYGNDANNVLDGKAGNDSLTGWLGDDTFYVDSSLDLAIEGLAAGTDTVNSRAANYTLGANVENMKLLDLGFVVLPGGQVGVLPAGLNGTGNGSSNDIEGNALGNLLNGAGGNDTMHGEGGNDTLDGGTGNDAMWGDAGDDIYIVDSALDTVTEYFGEGTDLVNASVSYTIVDSEVDNLTLTGVANISGTGNGTNNVITGNSGNNVIDGASGADTLQGGLGSDTYVVDNAGDTVIEGANAGSDWVESSITYTLVNADVENLRLTGFGATNGTGNASANHIDGNSAANVLLGLAGDDILHASGGNDTVQGGTGSDTIGGSTGIDTLRAIDNVFIVDDLAEDRFVFDTAPNAFNFDVIDVASFTQAGGEGVDDEIQLENFIFTNLLSSAGTNLGQLSAGHYSEGAGATGNSASAAIGIYNNTTTGELFYNPTFGVAGDSTLFAVVNVAGGSAVLSAEEFTLV